MPKIYRRKSDGAEVVVAKVHLGNLQKVASWLCDEDALLGEDAYFTGKWLRILSQKSDGKPFLHVIDPLSERREYIPSDEPKLPADQYEFLGEADHD